MSVIKKSGAKQVEVERVFRYYERRKAQHKYIIFFILVTFLHTKDCDPSTLFFFFLGFGKYVHIHCSLVLKKVFSYETMSKFYEYFSLAAR